MAWSYELHKCAHTQGKLDMHAGEFFLGMKFTQNDVHKINKNEQQRINGFQT